MITGRAEKILRNFVHAWRRWAPKKRIFNHFGTGYERNVLVSYITSPFTTGNPLVHINVLESTEIAGAFHDLGYNVDIVNHDDDGAMGYDKYDVIFGFGSPVVNSYWSRRKAVKVISYLPGMHNYVSNLATLRRVEDVYRKREMWLLSSSRFVPNDWTSIASISDAVFAVGGDAVLESYRGYTTKPTYMIPAMFFKIMDYKEILSSKDFHAAATHFFWFGSSGLVHKGLDLLLEVFAQLPSLDLHVCGPISREPSFESCYHRELYQAPNIHTHGYVPIDSRLFRDLLVKCGFIVFPSCAEGGPSSVLNVTGNGGLIPVVSREASVPTASFGVAIAGLSPSAVRDAVLEAAALSHADIVKRSNETGAYFAQNHSAAKYADRLRSALCQVLGVRAR